MADNDTAAPFFIPLIWQGDGPNPSPNYGGRASMFGVGGIPHSQWQGHTDDVGGGTTYPRYLGHYNTISPTDAPMEITPVMTMSGSDLVVTGEVTMTGDLSTNNNKMVFILTYDFTGEQTPDYFSCVIEYSDTAFPLTTSGEEGSYSASFPFDEEWDLSKVTAVVMVQTFNGNDEIFQATSTTFTGLFPLFSTNVSTGPASLGVQFADHSLPMDNIDSLEWDLDGNGVFDTTEENPYFLYTVPGTYDVTLRITSDGETAETTFTDYITVTDGSDISGNLSGIWSSQNNPYTISGDVTINPDDELVIESGTEVYTNGNSKIIVSGMLEAVGEDRAGILFGTDDGWKGIEFQNTMEDNKIENCEITGATECAISVEFSSVVILNNSIHGNTSAAVGAAIDLSSSDDVLIENNFIYNNVSANLTGGIGCMNSSPLIKNNIIVNNSSIVAGAFSLKNNSDAQIINNTIANNSANNGVFFVFNSFPIVTNSIIWDEGVSFFLANGYPDATYSCISDGFDGLGNIETDPMFTNPSAGSGADFNGYAADWTLAAGSPCIDAGNPDSAYNDADGTPNDMGAFGGVGFTLDSEDGTINVIPNLNVSVYPNPFNPETTIKFSARTNETTEIEIYNLKGRLVKQYDNIRNKTSVVWNGTDDSGTSVSSGLYFIKVTSGTESSLKKAILVK